MRKCKLILYVNTEVTAGVDCSLGDMMNLMEIIDYAIEELTPEEKEEFEEEEE
jgi:hypothetical protein